MIFILRIKAHNINAVGVCNGVPEFIIQREFIQ
jgi:hypothetical protein